MKKNDPANIDGMTQWLSDLNGSRKRNIGLFAPGVVADSVLINEWPKILPIELFPLVHWPSNIGIKLLRTLTLWEDIKVRGITPIKTFPCQGAMGH
jgi:hypothetical protein